MAGKFEDYVTHVLRKAAKPLTAKEIWDFSRQDADAVERRKMIGSRGKTPHLTIIGIIQNRAHIADFPILTIRDSGSRHRYFLRSREHELSSRDKNLVVKYQDTGDRDDADVIKAPAYSESDLHPILAYYSNKDDEFSKMGPVWTKTINHLSARHRAGGYSRWSNPDMVGVRFMFERLGGPVTDISEHLAVPKVQFISFEIKTAIEKRNYREAIFQTVSNSAWANESYLVTANISDDKPLHNEIMRLSDEHNIGVIRLDVNDIRRSRILYHCVPGDINMETMNKIESQNKDFHELLQNVNKDIRKKRVTDYHYDRVIRDIDDYIQDIL